MVPKFGQFPRNGTCAIAACATATITSIRDMFPSGRANKSAHVKKDPLQDFPLRDRRFARFRLPIDVRKLPHAFGKRISFVFSKHTIIREGFPPRK